MFYIVWSPEGPTNPRIKHRTSADAQVAASNMARKHVGQTFFVMKCAHEFRFDRFANKYGSWTEQKPTPDKGFEQQWNKAVDKAITAELAKDGIVAPAPEPSLGDILRDAINERPINQVPEGPTKEKTMYLIKFKTDVKINAIKTLRAITGIGLREAKDSIEQGLIVSSDQFEMLLLTFERQWKLVQSNHPMPIFEVSYYAPTSMPFQLPYGTQIADSESRRYHS